MGISPGLHRRSRALAGGLSCRVSRRGVSNMASKDPIRRERKRKPFVASLYFAGRRPN